MQNRIHDGYTESGVIKEVPRLHGELSFKWRPLTNEQLGDYAEAVSKVNGRRWKKLQAAVLARQLVEWSEKDDKGELVPIDPASVLSLKPRLFNRLFLIITGDDTPDDQPGQSEEEIGEEARLLLQAAQEDKPLAQVRREEQRKNS